MSHYLSSCDPTPQSILRATSQAYARRHPSKPKHDSVPDLHAALDYVIKIFSTSGEAARRHHLALLMIILGTKRASDIVRVWRHPRCIRFEVKRIDLPQWASTHRFLDPDDFHSVGLLRGTAAPLRNDEYVIFKFRSYLGKGAPTKNLRYGSWVSLVENRFQEALCPVAAAVRYLKATQKCSIQKKLRYGKSGVVSNITDDRGNSPIQACPFLISTSGNPRTGLQPSTVNGRIRRGLFVPLAWDEHFTPHSLRGMSTSYKLEYGVPKSIVQAVGDWSSDQAMRTFYVFPPVTPVSRDRLNDVHLHDLKLSRAHVLSKLPIPSVPCQNTSDDLAIAAALAP